MAVAAQYSAEIQVAANVVPTMFTTATTRSTVLFFDRIEHTHAVFAFISFLSK